MTPSERQAASDAARVGGADFAWQDAVVATLRATARRGDCERAVAGGAPRWKRIGGTALSSVWSLSRGEMRCFVKIADLGHADMLTAEAEGLQTIAATGSVRVPEVLATGVAKGAAFLALEWLSLAEGGRDAALARSLAAMHAATADRHGWHRDNTIGTTAQANGWSDDWAAFFRDRRLAPQLDLAGRHGGGAKLERLGARLLDAVPSLLAGHVPKPSLLHGDLWAGNAGALADGTPVVFDPAVYYGDRETDLAMSELFGGFAPSFHAAYEEAAPLPAGWKARRRLYNLYHVLNHFNLFGGSYLRQAESMAGSLIAAAT